MNSRKVSESKIEQRQFVSYQHLNSQRRLFGGMLMQWIDEIAGIVSARHCCGSVITAAVDSLIFKKPAFLGDMVVLAGRVTYTGHTSMEVRVDTFVEELDGRRSSINRAYLVMVAIDDDGNPTQVPQIEPETEEERKEQLLGQKRYDLRKKRRKEKF